MAHNHSVKENTGQIVGIVALGAFIGAGIAMLFAPKSGNQARAELKNKIKSMKSKSQEYKDDINQAADNAEGIAIKAKQKTEKEISKQDRIKNIDADN